MPSLLYQLIKFPARLAIKIYCSRLNITPPQAIALEGPLLIACNHPNSFLDAIILTTVFKHPVYSLARGDVFKNKWMAFIFKHLNMLPVYRSREGTENLEHNYKSFEACQNIFKKNGIVLIFSEGLCINEWHLRPLMKGTARLALSAWYQNIPLQILPAGINYHSFSRFGKRVQLNFGTPFSKNQLNLGAGFGKDVQQFNQYLNEALQPLVITLPQPKNELLAAKFFPRKISTIEKILGFIPFVLGIIVHAPFYYPLKYVIKKIANQSGHYDSLLVGVSFLLYPIYVIAVAAVVYQFWGMGAAVLLVLALPLLAYAVVQYKK